MTGAMSEKHQLGGLYGSVTVRRLFLVVFRLFHREILLFFVLLHDKGGRPGSRFTGYGMWFWHQQG